ncbi:MAG: hypothetical protein WBD02_02670 [Acidimicrobiia bacterium]
MKRISFNETSEAVLRQTKTVTRRNPRTWQTVAPGDQLQPVQKTQGLKLGEQQTLLGPPIIIISNTIVPADDIDNHELAREGFEHLTPTEFIQLLHRIGSINEHNQTRRIEFEYTNTNQPNPDTHTPLIYVAGPYSSAPVPNTITARPHASGRATIRLRGWQR